MGQEAFHKHKQNSASRDRAAARSREAHKPHIPTETGKEPLKVVRFPTREKRPDEIISPDGLYNIRGASPEAAARALRAYLRKRNRGEFWTSSLQFGFLAPFYSILDWVYTKVGLKEAITAMPDGGIPYANPFHSFKLFNPSTWSSVFKMDALDWEILSPTALFSNYQMFAGVSALTAVLVFGSIILRRGWRALKAFAGFANHPHPSVLTTIEDPTTDSSKMVLESMEKKRRKRLETSDDV